MRMEEWVCTEYDVDRVDSFAHGPSGLPSMLAAAGTLDALVG